MAPTRPVLDHLRRQLATEREASRRKAIKAAIYEQTSRLLAEARP